MAWKFFNSSGAEKTTIGGGVMTVLSDQTLGSDLASVDFTNIPATYKHLMIEYEAGTTDAADQPFFFRFNNDSAANYQYQVLSGSGGAVTAAASLAQSQGQVGTLGAGGNSVAQITIMNYAGTIRNKLWVATSYAFGTVQFASTIGGRYTSGAPILAINRITLLPTSPKLIGTGSRFTLYGLA